MYTQSIFRFDVHHDLCSFIRSYPLATLVTATGAGLEANILPLQLIEQGARIALRGHVSRAHSIVKSTSEATDALTVFQSPNAYISPRWYVNGQRSGRLAPSWNYVAVEARGRLRFVEDGEWMRAHLASLMASQEAHRERPWSMRDTAPEFADEAAKRLVGFEIDIEHVCGKRFLSQQRTDADRQSLVHHLAREPSGAARDVSKLICP